MRRKRKVPAPRSGYVGYYYRSHYNLKDSRDKTESNYNTEAWMGWVTFLPQFRNENIVAKKTKKEKKNRINFPLDAKGFICQKPPPSADSTTC